MSNDLNKKLVVDFLGYIDLELNLAANTISAYRQDLTEFCDFLMETAKPALSNIEDSDIFDFLINLRKKGISARSASRKLSTLKHLFKFMLEEKRISGDPTSTLESPKLLRALPDVLSRDEVTRLLETSLGEKPLSLRNNAILELWYACGLRISELSGLNLGDVFFEVDVLRVHGKGNKERLVPFGKYAKKALMEYLKSGRPALIREKSYDILFPSQQGGQLTRMGLWGIFEKYVKKAGITRPVKPHILRHSCATHMVEGGADIRTVMEFLGHADITTTQIYTHLDRRYLKEVHRRCHPREREYDRERDLQIIDVDTSTGKKNSGKRSL
jgi:integrase/recombinase XerD